MKKVIRGLIFLMAFQMEVRVRASADILEQPAACLKSIETCAIHVANGGFHLKQDGLKLHSTESSTLMRLSQDQWRLVRGTVWVEEASGVGFETPYANVKALHGGYWLISHKDKVLIRNINADLVVELRDGKKLEVPTGFEFWVAGINSDGRNEFGMIQPVKISEHLRLWNSLYQGSKEDFKKEVAQLKENWSDLVGKSSVIYQQIVDRKLASAAEERRNEEKKKRQAEAERQKTRELIYQRAFER
ncbi:MAG: hypothetical protein ACM3MG_04075 [Bacillota bacterium]